MSRAARWLTLIAATALAAAVAQLLINLVGADLTIPSQPGSDETMALPIMVTALVAGVSALVGLVGTAVLRRFTDRAIPIAVALGVAAVAFSMAPVLEVWSTVANPWGLVVLHLVVGAVALGGLPAAILGEERRAVAA